MVELDALEKRCAGNGTVGSNPTSSAIFRITISTKVRSWFTTHMDNQNQLDPQNTNTTVPPNQPVTPAAPTPPAPPPETMEAPKQLSKTEKLKRSFFQIMIGCLLGAATIAVIAVLLGSFSDILGRALGTIAMVALHALLSFSYISEVEKRDKKDGGRSIELFSNAVFTLIVVSFVTSIFAMWQLLGGELTLKLYLFYGVVLFATLHADVLYRISGFEKKIDKTVMANYLFMVAVVIMLSIVIFSGSSADLLGEFFYRLLAATAIVDATMTITAIIMHKLYLQKHPELAPAAGETAKAEHKSFLRNPLMIILIIFLVFQVIGSLIGLLFRGF